MIAANEHVFGRLTAAVVRLDRELPDLRQPRWLATTVEEKKWLQDLKISATERISKRVCASIAVLENEPYLFLSGLGLLPDDTVLHEVDVNAGAFTALVYELDIPLRQSIDPLLIVQQVFGDSQAVAGYSGHDLSTVREFFEPFRLYQILPSSPIKAAELIRLCCWVVLAEESRVLLPFSVESKDVLEDLLLQGPPCIPWGALFSAIQSSHWQHAFLETYRCIERIFPVDALAQLHQELSISKPLMEFCVSIERALGWRPREDDAIDRIFKQLPSTADALFQAVRTNLGANANEKLNRWFYELRNSIVHLRPASNSLKISDADWDRIVRATLFLLRELYVRHSSSLQAA